VARKNQEMSGGVVVVGAASHPLRDAYHSAISMSWPWAFGVIAGSYLAANALFAVGYMLTGGITGARPGSFADLFFFSVETMGTIGYGSMYPTSLTANVLMVAESVVGLVFTALATGLVFARFSRTTGEILFSHHACITLMDGVPSLLFRIGNDRATTIYEARVTFSLVRTEHTKEGQVFYRLHDLTLVRSVSQALARSFTIVHRIDDASPLKGETPESCIAKEIEFFVTVVGTDSTVLQPVHARHRYEMKDVLWGARPVDILRERPDGLLELDVRKFHDTEPTEPTTDFPYPARTRSVEAA
jgi:inward rectifier potassium channel